MRLRPFRRSDAPRFFELLTTQFPEEEAILGMRPEGFEAVIRRLYRPDTRLVLGLLRAFHRSPFHLYVIEDDGAIVGSTLLSFAARAGFVSTVMVAPEYRRRGYARRLIEAAREETARRRRPYVVLQVLAENAPARSLYASAGYAELDRRQFVVHDAPATLAAGGGAPGIRRFEKGDAPALATIADQGHPSLVRDVLPVGPRELLGGRIADRLFRSETAAWVVDRGRGPEAHVAATSTPTTEAAHLSTPIIAETVEPELAQQLLRVAGAWLSTRRPTRLVTSVPVNELRARAALEGTGFHDAIAEYTLYRSSR